MAKKVTKIPARQSANSLFVAEDVPAKRKACGYARVSTDREQQESSFDNQMRHYKKYITSRDDLEFVGMYADEGISATSTIKRDGFNQMVRDALLGKIDLIITKTVSRFARNTVDSLSTIRKLKENGVEVYFEEQNIYTFDSKGELLLTILSSFAQEESRNISENVKWGIRKTFEDGKVTVAYSRFLGFDRGANGGLVVNEDQAKIVKQIYKWFLEGLSCYEISKRLNANGVQTPTGTGKWFTSSVISILRNEKYKGDALLQKEYVADFLTKRRVKNNKGEVPQYYIEGDHEAIIEPAAFDLVQKELERRNSRETRYSGASIFSSKIKCGCCGGWYGAKVWNSNTKYRKIIYRCNNKYKGEEKCSSPTLTEDDIKKAFVSAVNRLLINKQAIAKNLKSLVKNLENTTAADRRIEGLRKNLSALTAEINELIDGGTNKERKIENYRTQLNDLAERYESMKNECDMLEKEREDNQANAKELKLFISELLKSGTLITEFNEELWSVMVDHVIAYSEDDIHVIFKDGTEITA